MLNQFDFGDLNTKLWVKEPASITEVKFIFNLFITNLKRTNKQEFSEVKLANL